MLPNIRLRRPSTGTFLGGLALLVATSGVAVAAIPGGDGAVTACVSSGGVIKVIDAEQGQTCPENQTTIRLASTDATGKVADADRLDGLDSTEFLGASAKAADADKLDGLDSTEFLGASALPGKVTQHWEVVDVPPGATMAVGASCANPGAVAVGGGLHWGWGPGHFQLTEDLTGIINVSRPAGSSSWSGVGTNDEATSYFLTATVICLNP